MVKGKVMRKNIVLASILALAAGAALAETAQKTHPVNCATAEGDLRAIAAEKKHAQDQQLESVAALTPAGALLGLVTGTENKRLSMLAGDYVNALDERAAKIKSECGVQ
ncbi:hypothetical protein [Ruegeria arenilitoris]|uniref:hypothetical protein n=1 Tax=Ruegeria arenilitoris TaxID=1173585 RepID=UPI0020C1C7FA|nr:hypothetical protein [Ruegeria arenilitoris]